MLDTRGNLESTQLKHSATRSIRAPRFTEFQRCFLIDEPAPLFGCPRLTIVYFQAFQDNAIPLPDSLFIPLRVLATFVPTIGAHPAEIVNSFNGFHDGILLSFDGLPPLLRDPSKFLTPVLNFDFQEPLAEYVMRPKSFFFHSVFGNRVFTRTILIFEMGVASALFTRCLL